MTDSRLEFPRTGAALLEDMRSLKTEREPIISEFISKGDVMMIAAEPGAGKSTLIANMALCLSTGSPLFGTLTTKKQRTYVLQTEGDYEETIERMRLMTAKIPLDAEYLCWDSFKLLDLNTPECSAEIIKRIVRSGMHPEVIVIDPIYKLTSLDISTGEGAMQVVRFSDMLKEAFGATMCLMHHNVKDDEFIVDGKKVKKKDAYYGHSFIKNHINSSYSLNTDEDTQTTTLTRKKSRGRNCLESMTLHFDPETMTYAMEFTGGSATDRLKVFSNTCKVQGRSTTFKETQKTCGLSTAHLRRLVAEGEVAKLFTCTTGKQGRQDWHPL